MTIAVLGTTALVASCGDDSGDSAGQSQDAQSLPTQSGVTVSEAWARPTAAGETAAVYLTLTGGEEDDALVGVSAGNVAEAALLHQSTSSADGDDTHPDGAHEDEMAEDDSGHSEAEKDDIDAAVQEELDRSDDTDGDDYYDYDGTDDGAEMMTMTEVEAIEVPAGATVVLEPGGYHIMLSGLLEDLEVGDSFEIVLNLDSGEQLSTIVEIRDY